MISGVDSGKDHFAKRRNDLALRLFSILMISLCLSKGNTGFSKEIRIIRGKLEKVEMWGLIGLGICLYEWFSKGFARKYVYSGMILSTVL